MKDLVVGSGLDLDDAGEFELEGVPGTWELYRVVDWLGLASLPSQPARPPPIAPRYARVGAADDLADGVRRFSVRREVGLVLGVYALYLLVARLVLARRGRERARENAHRVIALEERLGVDVEPAVQRALLRYPRLVHGLNVGYGLFNVTLTLGWIVILFRRRDEDFHRFRTACLLTHVGAQPAFLLFPTAPPRVLDGFVDTISEISGFDIEHPLLVRFYNPVAAMPSLHVAFAVVTGAEIAGRADSLLVRSVARAYAPLVATVVAGTGNHYVLDAVGGAALGVAARRLASD